MTTIFTPRAPFRKLPVGIQNFEKLRKEDYLYVDKTAFVYELTRTSRPYFLSRPRRFGKSLLLSTFKAYFEGKRELFKGLAIDQYETEWTPHPVLHLSLNAENYSELVGLKNALETQLSTWENIYCCDKADFSYSGRFMNVIKRAAEQTGRGVVVLIDEYDKPMLRSMNNEKLQDQFREMLTAFYTVLKDADEWLRFVFITGVTKFAQMGIFSTLNQLADISFAPDYGALCGMTCTEIETTFAPELERLANYNKLTYDACLNRLTAMYDGYRFNEDQTEGMYNPFSILNVLTDRKFRDYWFASGTPTFLAEMLKKSNYDLRKLDGIQVSSASLTDDRANPNYPVPMIYQSGYLTIKDYKERTRLYTLGYPNEEVKYGFLNFIAPFYTSMPQGETPFYIGKFFEELEAGDVEAMLCRLRAFFADFPYELSDRTERHYQVVFYLVFKLLGQFIHTEVRSARGRADAVVETADAVYVFEFKLYGTAEEALAQIDEKGYLIPYTADGRRLVKVGVQFSAEERNLGRWIIQE